MGAGVRKFLFRGIKSLCFKSVLDFYPSFLSLDTEGGVIFFYGSHEVTKIRSFFFTIVISNTAKIGDRKSPKVVRVHPIVHKIVPVAGGALDKDSWLRRTRRTGFK